MDGRSIHYIGVQIQQQHRWRSVLEGESPGGCDCDVIDCDASFSRIFVSMRGKVNYSGLSRREMEFIREFFVVAMGREEVLIILMVSYS